MLTGWTSWQWGEFNDPEFGVVKPPKYKYAEYCDLINNLQKGIPDMQETAEETTRVWEEYKKDPWLEGKKEEGEHLRVLRDQALNDLKDYCVKNRIYISPEEHQNGWVPVFDDKYIIQMSLRSWAGFMAEVWNQILGIESLDYLNFYCSDPDMSIKDYRKPNEI